jgi:hypothetical protein
MYFITAGEVEIELPSQRVRLSNGTFFGEIALLHRTKRSGTVTATRKTKLLALDAQDFHALIERLPDLAAHVKEPPRRGWPIRRNCRRAISRLRDSASRAGLSWEPPRHSAAPPERPAGFWRRTSLSPPWFCSRPMATEAGRSQPLRRRSPTCCWQFGLGRA